MKERNAEETNKESAEVEIKKKEERWYSHQSKTLETEGHT